MLTCLWRVPINVWLPVKHHGNVPLEEIYKIARTMRHNSIAKDFKVVIYPQHNGTKHITVFVQYLMGCS